MGYLTNYTISFHKHPDEKLEKPYKLEDVVKTIEDFSGYRFDGGYELYGYSIKWYNCEQDMKGVSAKFPELIFTVKGNGEEEEDIWIAYFRNGKMHQEQAEIVFPEFNEDKLED